MQSPKGNVTRSHAGVTGNSNRNSQLNRKEFRKNKGHRVPILRRDTALRMYREPRQTSKAYDENGKQPGKGDSQAGAQV